MPFAAGILLGLASYASRKIVGAGPRCTKSETRIAALGAPNAFGAGEANS
jgi:hypothetical protein